MIEIVAPESTALTRALAKLTKTTGHRVAKHGANLFEQSPARDLAHTLKETTNAE